MGIENPKQYTSEEIAKMEKSRTLSDAEILKHGAEYKIDEAGNKRLEITKIQHEAGMLLSEEQQEKNLLGERGLVLEIKKGIEEICKKRGLMPTRYFPGSGGPASGSGRVEPDLEGKPKGISYDERSDIAREISNVAKKACLNNGQDFDERRFNSLFRDAFWNVDGMLLVDLLRILGVKLDNADFEFEKTDPLPIKRIYR